MTLPHNTTFHIFGNCQAAGMAQLLRFLAPEFQFLVRRRNDGVTVDGATDWFVLQGGQEIEERISEDRTVHWPKLNFAGFHPDIVYVSGEDGFVSGPLGHYHSALTLWAWRAGLDVDDTVAMFNRRVFDSLGYLSFEVQRNALVARLNAMDFPGEALVSSWIARGTFMHTVNHPALWALKDLAVEVLAKAGLGSSSDDPTEFLTDNLKQSTRWPVYPEIAKLIGVVGSYRFKRPANLCKHNQSSVLGLEEFVEQSFATYDRTGRDYLACKRLDRPAYDALADMPRGEAAAADEFANPYRPLPDYHFWSRSVSRPESLDVVPVVHGMALTKTDRIATAGSCFAQHVARALSRTGYNYLVSEPAPLELSAEDAKRRQYGVYSARYGNVYTARQLLQLTQMAYGEFDPVDKAWVTPDGRWVDPFRPEIEPDRYDDADAVNRARTAHLQKVREMFEGLDIFVFTLGLTEGWRSSLDGAMVPLAPGVVARPPEPHPYEFVNFTTSDVAADLRDFIVRLERVNPKARIVLTVSPVPLIATYEDDHVLTATTHSKSVLRTAAQETAATFRNVAYFPSYEIVTGAHMRGASFESDLRSVKPETVAHVMDIFINHFARDGEWSAPEPGQPASHAEDFAKEVDDVICEEELIESGL